MCRGIKGYRMPSTQSHYVIKRSPSIVAWLSLCCARSKPLKMAMARTAWEAAALRSIGTPLAEFCIDIQNTLNQFSTRVTLLPGFDLPDPIAMAIALDPSVATDTQRLFVAVESESALCRGQTVVDHLSVTEQEPNIDVVLSASRERFLSMLHAAVKK